MSCFYDVCLGGSPLNLISFPPRHTPFQSETKHMKNRQELMGSPSQGINEVLASLDKDCKGCNPVTPLQCLTSCNVWKLRNELRRLNETLENPNFMKDLLNVLKNDTRLRILNAIGKSRYSVGKLQQELRKSGYLHSQDTINEEYLKPLLAVGLAAEAQEQFYATTFGSRLTTLVENIPEFANFLPAHSECHEENILKALIRGPRTIEEIEKVVPAKIVSRTLKRLKKSGLIVTPEQRDYIFFFRSKRDPSKEALDLTQTKVYEAILDEGTAANKLAQKTDLSLRRTYKYLRGLRGKKLVFARKTPKAYSLTEKGERVAWLLDELNNLVEETICNSEQFTKCKENS
jgi:DNA-binding HxlR family transcriptional regulator